MADLDGFLVAIDAKIAALQQLRQSYIAAVSVGAIGQAGEIDPSVLAPPAGGAAGSGSGTAPGSQSNGPIELPTGVFRDKGIADAIRAYLGMARRKQTFLAMKTALKEGGLATTSAFFDQTLSSTLHRMRKSGELLQFKDGWDLAASYPESFRQRVSKEREATTPRKKKGAKKTAAKARAKRAAEKTSEPSTKAEGEPLLRAV